MNLIDFFQQENNDDREYRVQRLMATLRGHKAEDNLCPAYDIDEEGNLTKTGEMSFIPGFALVNLPLSDEDRQEIKNIMEGKVNGQPGV